MSSSNYSRRRFLGQASAASSFLILPSGILSGRTVSPNSKLNIAAIGVGGQGVTDTNGCAGENIVALCDVDSGNLARRARAFPKAKQFRDYREMFEKMADQIDAVTVSTPDHSHFPASMMAMKLGKHVYCQKPISHSVWEARKMRETAAKHKVVTQMGNHGHSWESTRQVVEIVRSGAIGTVRDVHIWTNRPIWPQGVGRPASTNAPGNIDWDLWLGPAPERPYAPGYHPFKWRAFWDFGTGALGDMGCHNMDAAFWALNLGAPTSVEAEDGERNEETAPKQSVIRYKFPARGKLPPVTLTWYDGGRQPDPGLIGEKSLPANGTILLGSKGSIAFRDWNPNGFRLLPEDKFAGYQPPKPTLPRAPHGPYREWIDACKGGPMCLSNFDNAGPLTEMVLLGNVALRAGGRINWDAAGLQVKGRSSLNSLIKREYRKGWEV